MSFLLHSLLLMTLLDIHYGGGAAPSPTPPPALFNFSTPSRSLISTFDL